nr:peptidoglycan DD-metalloendopeptidase family protein [uncultured Gemmiger sp.]
MEEKTFDKEKAPAAGQKSSSAGHNRRRRRRKKNGGQKASQPQQAQKQTTATQPKAKPLAQPVPEEKSAAGSPAETSARPEAAEKPETVAQPVQTPEQTAEPAETAVNPEAPVKAEEPSAEPEKPTPAEPQAPEKPEPPQNPEPPEAAEPAESAEEPETTGEKAEKAEKAENTGKSGKEENSDSTGETASEEDTDQPEGENRAAEMTRTVQLSIEKIVETIEAEESEPEPAEEPDEEAEDPADKVPLSRLQQLHQQVGDSMWSLLKWVIFVIAFVAVVAGFGIAWLYKGATPDSIPKVSAEFNGETLQTTSYSWHVPVVANMFKRTYAETFLKDPVELTDTIQTAQVELDVHHPDCDTSLTIQDSSGETVFDGTAEEFGNYTFTKNDTYTAELVIFRNEKKISHTAEVSGKQTYLFSFTVSLRPSIRLNTVSATQGGVVAVRVSGGVSDQVAPTVSSQLASTAFHQGENDWVSYLAIPVDQEPGSYTITVSYAGYEQELSLTVKARANVYKDYTTKSKLTSPYIGESDTPAKVTAVLNTGDEAPAWTADGFNLPFTDKAEVALAYGTTEYVGRTRSERVAGTGTGRICNNVVVSSSRGSNLLAPAAGKIVLAEDLGGTAGYTVVIDHGAGVKSIFYCLRSISVKVGTTVKKGQAIATTDSTTIAEVRVGTVPVEPLSIWRGECDALNHY